MSFNPISNSHVPQIVQKALEISSRQCGSIQFKKMENLRLRYEFVGNYYLFNLKANNILLLSNNI